MPSGTECANPFASTERNRVPAIRDILTHVTAECADGSRKCRRDTRHKVASGEVCLVVKTGPMNAQYAYCTQHSKPMLDKAWKKLHDLYAFLDLTPPTP